MVVGIERKGQITRQFCSFPRLPARRGEPGAVRAHKVLNDGQCESVAAPLEVAAIVRASRVPEANTTRLHGLEKHVKGLRRALSEGFRGGHLGERAFAKVSALVRVEPGLGYRVH